MTVAADVDEPVEGVPLVLLHAFPLDARMWEGVVARLGAIPVVRLNAPGFGGSPVGAEGLEAFALGVTTTIRELGADEAVVAGLSMGGYVTMAIAEAAPGLLAGIGLLDTKATADPDPARQRRLRMVADVEAGEPDVASPMLEALLGQTTLESRPDVVAQVRGWLHEAPPAGLVWAQRSMAARPERLAALAALPEGLPALVLRGDEDGLSSSSDAQAMADALGTDVTEVPGVGHLAAVEDPDAVAAALGDLYRRAVE